MPLTLKTKLTLELAFDSPDDAQRFVNVYRTGCEESGEALFLDAITAEIDELQDVLNALP